MSPSLPGAALSRRVRLEQASRPRRVGRPSETSCRRTAQGSSGCTGSLAYYASPAMGAPGSRIRRGSRPPWPASWPRAAAAEQGLLRGRTRRAARREAAPGQHSAGVGADGPDDVRVGSLSCWSHRPRAATLRSQPGTSSAAPRAASSAGSAGCRVPSPGASHRSRRRCSGGAGVSLGAASLPVCRRPARPSLSTFADAAGLSGRGPPDPRRLVMELRMTAIDGLSSNELIRRAVETALEDGT